MQTDKKRQRQYSHRRLWLLPLLTILICSVASAEGLTWKTGQEKPLEQLDIWDYMDDPLFYAVEKDLIGEMVVIPGGSYQMGSNHGENDEKPLHMVSIRPFLLGKHEVTKAQWFAVMGSYPEHYNFCDNCPMENVSWDDVQAYIKQINKKTGGIYRLPTEAEWEYACRSGGKDEKYCGGANAALLSWYKDNSRDETQPVGQKQPNDLGLYDMSGNVYEWTQDCWHDSYHGAPSDGATWQSRNCDRRVLRGGSRHHSSRFVRSAERLRGNPDVRNFYCGFRLAQDI